MIFETSRKYLKADEVKPGDIITIMDEGEWVTSAKFTNPKTGEPKKDFMVKIDISGREADMTVNSTKRKALIKAFGKDSKDWVNKKCNCEVANIMVGDSMKKTVVLIPITGKADVGYEA